MVEPPNYTQVPGIGVDYSAFKFTSQISSVFRMGTPTRQIKSSKIKFNWQKLFKII